MIDLGNVYRSYRDRGFAALPVDREKHARVHWQELQDRLPTDLEIDEWVRQWPDSNVAIVMGRGRFVIDIDGDLVAATSALVERGYDLDGALMQSTGKGYHLLFATDRPIRNAAGWIKGPGFSIDVRGDGGYIVAWPSVHANGRQYTWATKLREPRMAPENLLEALVRRHEPRNGGGRYAPVGQPDWVSDLLRDGASEGGRNDAVTKLAGYLFRTMPDDVAEQMILTWNEARNTPPLPRAEVEASCRSIQRKAMYEKNVVALDPDALRAEVSQKSDARSAGAILAGMVSRLRDRVDILETPYAALNRLLHGGILSHEYTILAARPSVGKTAMAIELCEHAAEAGRRVLLVSIEMSPESVAERLAVRRSGIEAGVLRAGGLTDEQYEAFVAAAADVARLPLVIEGGLTRADQIRDAVEQAAKDGEPYGLVVVDYLQIMQPAIVRKDARRLEVDDTSAVLKSIPKYLRVPVVVISEINRAGATEPTIKDLKESGSLEYQADNILLLHREQFSPQVEVIIGKARNAQVGRFALYFDGKHQRFSETAIDFTAPSMGMEAAF